MSVAQVQSAFVAGVAVCVGARNHQGTGLPLEAYSGSTAIAMAIPIPTPIPSAAGDMPEAQGAVPSFQRPSQVAKACDSDNEPDTHRSACLLFRPCRARRQIESYPGVRPAHPGLSSVAPMIVQYGVFTKGKRIHLWDWGS